MTDKTKTPEEMQKIRDICERYKFVKWVDYGVEQWRSSGDRGTTPYVAVPVHCYEKEVELRVVLKSVDGLASVLESIGYKPKPNKTDEQKRKGWGLRQKWWERIRNGERQLPLYEYVADFPIHARMLILEALVQYCVLRQAEYEKAVDCFELLNRLTSALQAIQYYKAYSDIVDILNREIEGE